jgi:hypothetical protein
MRRLRVSDIELRGREEICRAFRLCYHWLVYIRKDVQWLNSFTSNFNRSKWIFFCEGIFFAYIKTSPLGISIPSVIMTERKSPSVSFHQRHKESFSSKDAIELRLQMVTFC